MDKKNSVGCAFSLLQLLVVQPIWYYLLYQILLLVHATDIMWFLFWVYLPVAILVLILGRIFEYALSDDKGG